MNPVKQIFQTHELNSSDKKRIQKLFLHQLKEMYWTQKALSEICPELAKAATTLQLTATFDVQAAQTNEHVFKLEKIFDYIGSKPQISPCTAIKTLVEDFTKIMSSETHQMQLATDLELILAAKKILHHQIAVYSFMIVMAHTAHEHEVAEILKLILDKHNETNLVLAKLTPIFVLC